MEPQNLYSVKNPPTPHTHPVVSWDWWIPVVIKACPSRLDWMEQRRRGPVLVVPPPQCVSLGKEHTPPPPACFYIRSMGEEKQASLVVFMCVHIWKLHRRWPGRVMLRAHPCPRARSSLFLGTTPVSQKAPRGKGPIPTQSRNPFPNRY